VFQPSSGRFAATLSRWEKGSSVTPPFREPWQAEAFALAVALQDRGLITAREWADALGAAIRAAQAGGDPDTGDTYWRHWLAALETLLAAKWLASPVVVAARAGSLAAAAAAKAHPAQLALPANQ
jgi:nitrile hydratase accessory protein